MGEPKIREKDKEEAEKRDKTHHMNGDVPGMVEDRGCTDIIVCLLFCFMMVVMVVIMGWAFGNGDLKKIATKFDMDGNNCTEEYPNKLFTRLLPKRQYEGFGGSPAFELGTPDTMYWAVCAAECPKKE